MKEVYAPSDMEEMEVGISKVSRALEMQGCTGIKKKKVCKYVFMQAFYIGCHKGMDEVIYCPKQGVLFQIFS